MPLKTVALLLVLSVAVAQFEDDNRGGTEKSLEESDCVNKSCYPQWGNLLKGRKVFADSTCGESTPEEYCLVSNERKDIICDVCDASKEESKHPPFYMKDRRIKSNTTWWKAQNGKEEVTLQLDLETMFQFTHLIMVFYSFRPAGMVIERSVDRGLTWIPYQYFAYDCEKIFGMRERELGEPDEYGVGRHPDEDVICTSLYSQIEPAQGGEVIYKVVRGRPTTNPNRPSLRKLLLLTNLRVRFVKLHTLGDEIFRDLPNDQIAKKQYFYAVEDWVVRGSCFCNGHADVCTDAPGFVRDENDMFSNMIHGRCLCQHDTDGDNCERCKEFHHKLPWRPGDPSGAANACEECNCNDHSNVCLFDEELYAQTGDGGRCTACKDSTAGVRCDSCVYGYYQVDGRLPTDKDICQACTCNEAGTTSRICAPKTTDTVKAGSCICKANVAEDQGCGVCKEDHYNLDSGNPLGCTACGCDQRGTVNSKKSCDLLTGQCECREAVTGRACDRCKEGYFNVGSDEQFGCSKCSCDTPGSLFPSKCDPVTGACFCKEGFQGYKCDEIKEGYFVPKIDYWSYDPENSGIHSKDSDVIKSEDADGTGYVVVPADGLIAQDTDKDEDKSDIDEDEDSADLQMPLPSGYYDLKFYYDPVDVEFSLEVEVHHQGNYDGTKPQAHTCGDGSEATTLEPFSKQSLSVVITPGSRMSRLQDVCLERGSQYNIKISVPPESLSTLAINDIIMVKPEDPDKTFPWNVALRELYREYQEAECPLDDTYNDDLSNNCYRLKTEIEELIPAEQLVDKVEPCTRSPCLPDQDVWDFVRDKDTVETEGGAHVDVKEGGTVTLPGGSKMVVPLEPGSRPAGVREIMMSHGDSPALEDTAVVVIIRNTGSREGTPKSYRCSGDIIRPYNEVKRVITAKKGTSITSLGEACLDPKGTYEIEISPVDKPLVVTHVYVTLPAEGDTAYPDDEELADLWDKYIAEDCPRIEGLHNSDKKECIKLINQIRDKQLDDDKIDCTVRNCIPYDVIWRPKYPIIDLNEGAYINPENHEIVLPESKSRVIVPVDGSNSITGSLVDLLIKHGDNNADQSVNIDLKRLDSEDSYPCGVLQNVPPVQKLSTVFRAGTDVTIISSLCIDPSGEYELIISAGDTSDAITISEISSVLPKSGYVAFPDDDEARAIFEEYLRKSCEMYPTMEASAECKHLANLIDHQINPERKGTKDCTVQLCYPNSTIFSPEDEDRPALSGNARISEEDGSVELSPDGKVTFDLDPLITGPNTVVIEYEAEATTPVDIYIKYKGTIDGKDIDSFTCRGELVVPGNVQREGTELVANQKRLEFEECLLFNGDYELVVEYTGGDAAGGDSEAPTPAYIKQVFVELPRDAEIFDTKDRKDTLQKLLDNCIDKEFTAECAMLSKDLEKVIDDINNSYKVNCKTELCLIEERVWEGGDPVDGDNIVITDGGGVVLPTGESEIVFDIKGDDIPNNGLNTLVLTVNSNDFRRVADVLISPKDLTTPTDKVSCGSISSGKQQIVRKTIPVNMAAAEVGPVCLTAGVDYEVRIVYKGVLPPNTDRLYPDTKGITLHVKSVDLVLPTKPEDAFPENEKAADIWEKYIQKPCPRLNAVVTGYEDVPRECYELLDELNNLLHDIEQPKCDVSVCLDNTGGWQHDPASDDEEFTDGATVSGGNTDADIVIPPGGEVTLNTGEKETAVPAENIPNTGLKDIVITHKKSGYGWQVEVSVEHVKTKGDVIPQSYSCGSVTVTPFSTQVIKGVSAPCTSSTRLSSVCLSKDNTYRITTSVVARTDDVGNCVDTIEDDTGLPIDQIVVAFPEDPEVAFPGLPETQEAYEAYLDAGCTPEDNRKACSDLNMDIIAQLLDQSVGCNCDDRGSTSDICESVGGQCPCKEGYTGRRCNICSPTFYPTYDPSERWTGTCLPCNCNEYGSKTPVCDDNGQCPCYGGVVTAATNPDVRDCSECLTGFVGLDNPQIEGCIRCSCGEGSKSAECNEVTGTCLCHPGVAGPYCNECSPGFYDLVRGVGCKQCGCNKAGSDSITCNSTTGQCSCKKNVVGTKCDSCLPQTIDFNESNPHGCISCYCNGITKECGQADGYRINNKPLTSETVRWSVVEGLVSERRSHVMGAIRGRDFIWRLENLGDRYNSYGLSLSLDLVISEEHDDVVVRIYRDDIYVTAVLDQPKDQTFSIYLYEDNFKYMDTNTASVHQLRYILTNITQFEVATMYKTNTRHYQRLKNFILERAVVNTNRNFAKASNIELCACPEGYEGHACGSCKDGFGKNYTKLEDGSKTFECVECRDLCNGNSDVCDAESAVCSDCANNTEGERCEECVIGYYKMLQDDGRFECLACPCDQNTVSPSCSIGKADDFPVCDACEKGYLGPNCNECAPGYFGKDGNCTMCKCNGNIDSSNPYSCSKEDGVCQLCLYNTTGNECGECLPGFHGNATSSVLPKCKPCNCHPVGSQSEICDQKAGICECHDHVTGVQCDKCIAGYWNMSRDVGCEPCWCNEDGSNATTCDMVSGQCPCRYGIQGRQCDRCRDGYYSLNTTVLECMDCQCNPEGSKGTQCDSEGQCECRAGVAGRHCGECARGSTGTFPDCVPCGECYDQWEAQVVGVEDEIAKLANKAQNLYLGEANLTESELRDILKDLREDLAVADKLVKSLPAENDDIITMTAILTDLNDKLQRKNDELESLDTKLNDMEDETKNVGTQLDNLKEQIEKFKESTYELSERAKTLHAANLDEALKLIDDAAKLSAEAKQNAKLTEDDIAESKVRADNAKAILSDPIFDDTSLINSLDDLEDEINDLESKLNELDGNICGVDDGTCSVCGGSSCDSCGGEGCSGVVGVIDTISSLADKARTCVDERQNEITDANSVLRELSARADTVKDTTEGIKEQSVRLSNNVTDLEQKLEDAKRKMDEFLARERVLAADVKAVVDATEALQLPLSEDELSELISSLIEALDQINLSDTNFDTSMLDEERVQKLLDRARKASEKANSTLESIVEATSALIEFDATYQEASQTADTVFDVTNKGWEHISKIEENTEKALKSREGLPEEIDKLEEELQLLLTDIKNGDEISKIAQDKIDATKKIIRENEKNGESFKDEYDKLDKMIDKKNAEIDGQIGDTTDGSDGTNQIQDKIADKLDTVESYTKEFIIQQEKLVDLNDELDVLEEKLDEIMARINDKAVYHSVCNTDNPAK